MKAAVTGMDVILLGYRLRPAGVRGIMGTCDGGHCGLRAFDSL